MAVAVWMGTLLLLFLGLMMGFEIQMARGGREGRCGKVERNAEIKWRGEAGKGDAGKSKETQKC